jgi:hypothetical protein
MAFGRCLKIRVLRAKTGLVWSIQHGIMAFSPYIGDLGVIITIWMGVQMGYET